jgi:hypothetical protein
MDAQRGLQDALTGDILLARTARTSLEGFRAADWTPVGVVIHPRDVGVQSVSQPVFYTVRGTLGELVSTMRSIGDEDVRIAVGPTEGSPHLLPHVSAAVRAALITADVEPVDQTAETVLDKIKRHAGVGDKDDPEQSPNTLPPDPRSVLHSIWDAGRRGGIALPLRHCRHGKVMPCDGLCPPGAL